MSEQHAVVRRKFPAFVVIPLLAFATLVVTVSAMFGLDYYRHHAMLRLAAQEFNERTLTAYAADHDKIDRLRMAREIVCEMPSQREACGVLREGVILVLGLRNKANHEMLLQKISDLAKTREDDENRVWEIRLRRIMNEAQTRHFNSLEGRAEMEKLLRRNSEQQQ